MGNIIQEQKRRKCRRSFQFVIVFFFCPLLAADPQPEIEQGDNLNAFGTEERAFTLEQILSSPFAAELTGSSLNGRVAWTTYDSGIRNIWAASLPDYLPRQVTTYDVDDGQEIRQLAYTPNGDSILFVRGSSANPLSLPEAEPQAIWSVGVDGENLRRLAEGYAPTISPNGTQIAFLRQGEAWIVPFLENASAERLFDVGGRVSSLRWSPDGSQIAFVSERGNFDFGNSYYSFIGVFDLDENQINWLDPSVYRDHGPVWSPDGSQVAFVRMRPALTHRSGYSRQLGLEPWSIRVADLTTGSGREVFQALPGPGEIFQPNRALNPILWTVDGQLVFPWERDGWLHLYSISTTGGTPKLLTPGDYEIEQVTLDPLNNGVVYTSNEGDIDRRHIWRVSLTDGQRQLLTPGNGIESSPVIMTNGDVLLLRSDSRRSVRPAVIRNNEPPQDMLPSENLSDDLAMHLVDPQPVELTAADGFKTHGQLFLSKNATQKQPAVIFLHGGPQGQQQLLGWWSRWRVQNQQDYAFIQYLVSRGYTVLSLNYRSGAGYGLEFREAPDHGTSGASEYNDVLAAAHYLRSHVDVDPERIALWGPSFGGYLTALGLARNSDLFAAGVVFYGPYDWVQMWGGAAIPETSDEVETQRSRELARSSSPIASVDAWKSPVLIIHGGDDQSVDFEQAVMLAEDLYRRDVEVEVLVYPDEPHGFLAHRHVLRAYQTVEDFFNRRLKGASVP